jgi:Type IV secretion-system coupling protein DNA-binding domain
VKSAALTWHRLRWPREVTPEQVMQLMRLLATVAGTPAVVETVGMGGGVEHRLALPAGRAGTVVDQLRVALPGLAVERLGTRPPVVVSHAVRVGLSTNTRPLRSDDLEGSSHVLLTALGHLRRGEHVVLQWVLARSLRPVVVPNHVEGQGRESWLAALALAPLSPPAPLDAGARAALRLKQETPGWRAVGRIGVLAPSPARERQLVGQMLAALNVTAAPGVHVQARLTRAVRVNHVAIGWWWPLRLNANELAALSTWPCGLTRELPIARLTSRLLPPSTAIPRRGRVLGLSSFPGRERPLALSPVDGLRHIHALGPTGSGKSTLLLNLITGDLAAGRGLVVVDPKGDLINDVLRRVPVHRLADVVLLDPTDTARPVGLNPLAPDGRSPELVADQLLGLFHSLYAAHWGPRTQDILGASLLTLARTPGMTLAALPVLLTDAAFRRRVVPTVSDPLGLGSFWRTFESWREPERLSAIAPSMNKLRPLLMRPDLRAIIGQAQPRFALRQVFTERKVLLVNLAVGQIGPETAALLGSLVIAQLWQAILGRSALPPERRAPLSIVLDEFQTYLHLPLDLADALAQARGLGASFALAHQFMHQLDPGMRSAVLANAQTRIAFRLPSEDARLMAAGSELAPDDFQGLGAFAAYAQVVAGGAVQPWCSLTTVPPSEPVSDPALVRTTSRLAYGMDRAVIEAELTALVTGSPATTNDDLTPRRRQPGGAR